MDLQKSTKDMNGLSSRSIFTESNCVGRILSSRRCGNLDYIIEANIL